MQINKTITNGYHAQERYQPSAPDNKSSFADIVNGLNREDEKADKDWRTMSEKEWDRYIKAIDEKIEDMQESVRKEAGDQNADDPDNRPGTTL